MEPSRTCHQVLKVPFGDYSLVTAAPGEVLGHLLLVLSFWVSLVPVDVLIAAGVFSWDCGGGLACCLTSHLVCRSLLSGSFHSMRFWFVVPRSFFKFCVGPAVSLPLVVSPGVSQSQRNVRVSGLDLRSHA